MSSRYILCAVLLDLLMSGFVYSDSPANESAAKEAQSAFSTERQAPDSQRFANSAYLRSDALATQAERALTERRFAEAVRLYRLAHRSLPAHAAGLPAEVERVYGTSRLKLSSSIRSLAVSPDGRSAVAGSLDGRIKVWSINTGTEMGSYSGHSDKVSAIAITPDSQFVASAGSTVRIWELPSGRDVRELRPEIGGVEALAISPDGRLLAVAGNDKTVRLYTLADGKELVKLTGPNSTIWSLAFSPDSKLVAAGDAQGHLTVWPARVPTKDQQMTFAQRAPVQRSPVLGLAFMPTGKAVAIAGDKAIRLIGTTLPDGTPTDKTSQKLAEFVAGTEEGQVQIALAVSKDGHYLAGGGKDGIIRIWDTRNNRLLRTLVGHTGQVTAIAFVPGTMEVVSVGDDQSVRVWPLGPVDPHRPLEAHKEALWTVAVRPDGKQAASAGSDRIIRLWNPVTGQTERELPGHKGAITALTYRDNQLYTASGDKLIKIWDSTNGQVVGELSGHTDSILALAVVPGGQLLSSGRDRTVRLWDLASQKSKTLGKHAGSVSAVCVSPDGKLAVSADVTGTLKVWDLVATKELTHLDDAHRGGVSALVFANNSLLVSTGFDKLVKLWNCSGNALAPVAELKGHTAVVSALATSADGKFLASCGGDQIIRVWDLNTRTEVRGLRGHSDWVTAVAFAPNGQWLISAGLDRMARLWELTSAEAISEYGHARSANAVAISSDGKILASASSDRTVKLWDTQSGQEIRTLTGPASELRTVALSSDGKRILASEENRLWLWDDTGKVLMQEDLADPAFLVAFGEGGKALAWTLKRDPANDVISSVIQSFSPEGKRLEPLREAGRRVSCAAISGDGRLAVTGDADGVVRLWRLDKNEREGADWPISSRRLEDLSLSADGKTLVTCDERGEVQVWDVTKRQVRFKFTAHKNPRTVLTVSPDGQLVLTADVLGNVNIWNGNDLAQKWRLPVAIRAAIISVDGKSAWTANPDSTLYRLRLP